jgi:hypothetical protein
MASDTRLWMYRNGEACLFEHPDQVPSGEGWRRFPCHNTMEEAAPRPGIAPGHPGSNGELTAREKLDRMPRQRLMRAAADCGIRFDFSWTKAQLKQAIIEALNDNRA